MQAPFAPNPIDMAMRRITAFSALSLIALFLMIAIFALGERTPAPARLSLRATGERSVEVEKVLTAAARPTPDQF